MARLLHAVQNVIVIVVILFSTSTRACYTRSRIEKLKQHFENNAKMEKKKIRTRLLHAVWHLPHQHSLHPAEPEVGPQLGVLVLHHFVEAPPHDVALALAAAEERDGLGVRAHLNQCTRGSAALKPTSSACAP